MVGYLGFGWNNCTWNGHRNRKIIGPLKDLKKIVYKSLQLENTCSHTWLEYLIIRAVGHIEPTQLDSNLIAACFAHREGHFDYVGLRFLQNLLCNRNVQR